MRTCQQLGLNTYCWQQRQERLNRELKAMRETNSRRTVIDLLDEVRRKEKEFEDIQMDALLGRGEWRLVQPIRHLEISEAEWNSFSNSKQAEHLERFRRSKPGEY